jgi:hypothetical protein
MLLFGDAMKRQQTQWIWLQTAAEGTFIRVGYIHNKNQGVALDKIRVQIHSKHCNLDFNMRLDEASGLAAGINKVICVQTLKGRISDTPNAPREGRAVARTLDADVGTEMRKEQA